MSGSSSDTEPSPSNAPRGQGQPATTQTSALSPFSMANIRLGADGLPIFDPNLRAAAFTVIRQAYENNIFMNVDALTEILEHLKSPVTRHDLVDLFASYNNAISDPSGTAHGGLGTINWNGNIPGRWAQYRVDPNRGTLYSPHPITEESQLWRKFLFTAITRRSPEDINAGTAIGSLWERLLSRMQQNPNQKEFSLNELAAANAPTERAISLASIESTLGKLIEPNSKIMVPPGTAVYYDPVRKFVQLKRLDRSVFFGTPFQVRILPKKQALLRLHNGILPDELRQDRMTTAHITGGTWPPIDPHRAPVITLPGGKRPAAGDTASSNAEKRFRIADDDHTSPRADLAELARRDPTTQTYNPPMPASTRASTRASTADSGPINRVDPRHRSQTVFPNPAQQSFPGTGAHETARSYPDERIVIRSRPAQNNQPPQNQPGLNFTPMTVNPNAAHMPLSDDELLALLMSVNDGTPPSTIQQQAPQPQTGSGSSQNQRGGDHAGNRYPLSPTSELRQLIASNPFTPPNHQPVNVPVYNQNSNDPFITFSGSPFVQQLLPAADALNYLPTLAPFSPSTENLMQSLQQPPKSPASPATQQKIESIWNEVKSFPGTDAILQDRLRFWRAQRNQVQNATVQPVLPHHQAAPTVPTQNQQGLANNGTQADPNQSLSLTRYWLEQSLYASTPVTLPSVQPQGVNPPTLVARRSKPPSPPQ